MKALLILLLISYVKGDKLNKLYLPPVGANDSGGLSGDIEVPFEVPVQKYFGIDEALKLITEKEPDESFHSIGSSTHAPSVSSVTSYDDKSTISVSGGNTETKDDLRTPNDVNEDYNTNQLFDYYNEKPVPITNDKNQSNNIDAAPETSKPSNSIKEFSNYKGSRISPISNEQYVPNFDYYITNVKRILRPQTESDRSAIVLSDENVITPERFSYSYDTSNGIHADEIGTATDGVKAHGSYSYVGDDGKLYNVTYTADENGFRPRGDHLPTPPPIPEAILKVIEQAAIDKSNGIFDDGSYDENKYGYKKYENSVDRFNNSIPSRRFNSGSNKPRNNQPASTGNSIVENFIPISTISPSYTIYGKNDNFNEEPASNDQDTGDDKNQETVNYDKTPNHPHNQKESELDNAFNRDFHTSDFPNILEENGLGYKYLSPKNKFVFRNNINTESSNDFGNKSPPTYVYDKSYTPKSDINQKLFLTRPLNTTYSLDLDKNKNFINLGPNSVTDDGYISIKNPDIDNFGQRNSSQPPTVSSYISTTLTSLYLPQGRSKAPQVTYEVSLPSSSERIIPVGTYTDRQSNFYGPSSTEIIKQLDAHTDRPSNFYQPSSTESIKQLDAYNNRPSNFYGPSSTSIMNLPGTNTDRPRYFYGLPTTDRVKEAGTYANETDIFYGPTSTETINLIGTNDDQLSDFYGSMSNERIKPIGAYTDGPNEFYDPSSTERIFGDNFAGPKQPQSYNPQTGYHY